MEQDVFDIRMEVLDVKETRTKELLRFLVDMGKLVDDGATKGKRYQLKCMDGTNKYEIYIQRNARLLA